MICGKILRLVGRSTPARYSGETEEPLRLMELLKRLDVGADPRAWFGLEAEPGFGFADAPRGATLQPAAPMTDGRWCMNKPATEFEHRTRFSPPSVSNPASPAPPSG